MNDKIEAALEAEGWEVECESPLELRLKDDPESFASGHAASLIIELVMRRGRDGL